jgi:hypothetical protein
MRCVVWWYSDDFLFTRGTTLELEVGVTRAYVLTSTDIHTNLLLNVLVLRLTTVRASMIYQFCSFTSHEYTLELKNVVCLVNILKKVFWVFEVLKRQKRWRSFLIK